MHAVVVPVPAGAPVCLARAMHRQRERAWHTLEPAKAHPSAATQQAHAKLCTHVLGPSAPWARGSTDPATAKRPRMQREVSAQPIIDHRRATRSHPLGQGQVHVTFCMSDQQDPLAEGMGHAVGVLFVLLVGVGKTPGLRGHAVH